MRTARLIALLAGAAALVTVFTFGSSRAQDNEIAVFAGGCFWCMEPPFDKLYGVISTTSGYTGGHVENPTYEQVSRGDTGHYEAIQITYNPSVISYQKLLETYWANVDPLDAGGQFCDRGDSYKSAIFYASGEQKDLAQRSKIRLDKKLEQDIATEIFPLETFYPAEDYHQDYYLKNPKRYKFYRWRCGRDNRLEELWGKQAGESLSLFR